jgi:hypothetical protein
MMHGMRIANFKAALAGIALAACAMPGPSVAQSSYYEYPYYSQPGDPNHSDYGRRSASAANRNGTVEAIELERNGGHAQRISVRMDDGTSRVFAQDAPELRAGDRVRVERDGHLELA